MKMNLGWMRRVVAKLVGDEDKMIKKGGLLKKKKLVNWVSRSSLFKLESSLKLFFIWDANGITCSSIFLLQTRMQFLVLYVVGDCCKRLNFAFAETRSRSQGTLTLERRYK